MGNGGSLQRPEYGYHVLKVVAGSPGEEAGLCPFFDFLVKADEVVLDKEDRSFVALMKSKLGQEVECTVYNSKTSSTRVVILKPSNTWGGRGLLGTTLQFCSISSAIENVYHILEVSPHSPAEEAGLESNVEWVVGTPDIPFSNEEDFFQLVEAHVDKPLQLFVYNVRLDNVRLVTITPRRGWGGSGCLGCGVGYGYLHRIPFGEEATKTVEEEPIEPLQAANSSFDALPSPPSLSPSPQTDDASLSVPPSHQSNEVARPTESSPGLLHESTDEPFTTISLDDSSLL
ncbi:Golgi reassembly-stacking protein 1 [Balamuthia mandrillaris]